MEMNKNIENEQDMTHQEIESDGNWIYPDFRNMEFVKLGIKDDFKFVTDFSIKSYETFKQDKM